MSAHLKDARIDLQGNAVPIGQMLYSTDPEGHFPTVPHTCLRLEVGKASVSLSISEAKRDTVTGFMMSRLVGPTLRLPEPLSATIIDVLTSSFLGERRMTLGAQEGDLSFSEPDADFGQNNKSLSQKRSYLASFTMSSTDCRRSRNRSPNGI